MAEQPGRNGRTVGPPPAYVARGASGQIAVMFALSMLAIVPLMGLIFDGGNIYVQRRTAQNAADAASLAGTRALQHVPTSPDPTPPNLGETTVAEAVCQYVTANSFGIQPKATAHFVDTSGVALSGLTLSTDPSDVTNTVLQCGKPILNQPRNPIPNGAAGVHVDATIGPFPTFIAGFLGKGIASGDGAGIARATTTAGATVQGLGMRQAVASNSPFIICGVDTFLAPGDPDGLTRYPILQMTGANPELPSGTPKSPAQINDRAYGKTFVVHGVVDRCGADPTWKGLSDMTNNAGIGSLDLEATPAFILSKLGSTPNGTSNNVTVFNGCDTTVGDWSNCYMQIPIATSTGAPNNKWCVTWATFLITVGGGSVHYAQLTRDVGFAPFSPYSVAWTWGGAVALPMMSTSVKATQ